ncbi:MAG: hypothetical protein ACRD3B_07115 [Candidatus Sulfotelmatobacter sp.]
MSDFLSNLVGRSFGTAPVVRPRLTSLFEPVREDAAKFQNVPEIKREETLEAVEDEVFAEDRHLDDGKPKSRVARVAANEAQHEAPIRDEPPSQPVGARSPRLVREPQRGAVTESEKADANLPAVPTRRNAPDRIPVTTATEHERGPVNPASAAPAILPTARQPEPENNQRGLLLPPKLTPEMRIPALAEGTRSDRKSHHKEGSFQSGRLQPLEHTVNVTIGRIEVRATKENSRAARASSPSPVMSLDEYLRDRARQAGS